ncbi:hypothetical protein JOF47_000027 [Paeniglutamicibacter kerguelensis]|uniref:Uncharacterized protein n=1 Tax=Paeniglutamicibacter kerguelensis TaxID=254788 RepID=A0ABS4X7S7_9MICC|nr:hypothetical protein [Paeniglutamicibacter kerguelensis]
MMWNQLAMHVAKNTSRRVNKAEAEVEYRSVPVRR